MTVLSPGDRVEICEGEWATIIAYDHRHDGGNGFARHGLVLFRWRDGEHAVSTASHHGTWRFGNSTYFLPGMEHVAAELWRDETGQLVTLAPQDPGCDDNGCYMFGGAPGCSTCPARDRVTA